MSEAYTLLEHESGGIRQTALLSEKRLLEYTREEAAGESLVGALFLGRVERVLPQIKAAFVKLGLAQNGFLPIREQESFHQVNGPAPLLTGQDVLVQVKKDPKGEKGAFLTRDVILPGQYVLLMPMNHHVGVSKRIEGVGVMPWAGRGKEESFEWTDNDDAGLRMYTEKLLGYRTEAAVKDALVQAAMIRSHNPLQDYLNGLVWDGVPRLDTVYIDYFGDEDNIYTREVGRKSLTAAVARAMQPGIKYDTMVVISGPQGTCKTTFVERIGKSWQTSLLVSFKDPKAVAEVLQNNWIVEIAELSSLNKADNNTAKQIITQTSDEYRAAYARSTEKHKRHSVFFGTTNDMEYLKDPTGNRRFWPIHCGPKPEKHIWEELTPQAVDQLWAEAVTYWRIGEPLILSKEAEAIAETRREEHLERDELEGLISAYLDIPIPTGWKSYNEEARVMYFKYPSETKEEDTVQRDRVCVAEIWRECLFAQKRNLRPQDSRRIARIMDRMPGWERTRGYFGIYGHQKGWIRKSLP